MTAGTNERRMVMTGCPEFTYQGYLELLELLNDEGYAFASYSNWEKKERPVILRHDIDYDVRAALKLAKIEEGNGVTSTYFVLLRNGLYNCLSVENVEMIRRIAECGHEIGLHFDEKAYSQEPDMVSTIRWEADVLSQALGLPVKSVSMHRPSKACLEGNWSIPGLVNSYGKTYCGNPFKYLSDSRRRWREPAFDVIKSGNYTHLHILTHAFWYKHSDSSLVQTIEDFLYAAGIDRKELLYRNFTDLGSVLNEKEPLE